MYGYDVQRQKKVAVEAAEKSSKTFKTIEENEPGVNETNEAIFLKNVQLPKMFKYKIVMTLENKLMVFGKSTFTSSK